MRGRPYVLPVDVSDMAHDVMRHRIMLSFEAHSEGVTGDHIVAAILGAVPVPALALQQRSDGRLVRA
jgi:MoxR-like ATPase